jgi:hypothetical protein
MDEAAAVQEQQKEFRNMLRDSQNQCTLYCQVNFKSSVFLAWNLLENRRGVPHFFPATIAATNSSA